MPTVGGHLARPMAPEEIDQHPDADRIWATIKQVADLSDDERLLPVDT